MVSEEPARHGQYDHGPHRYMTLEAPFHDARRSPANRSSLNELFFCRHVCSRSSAFRVELMVLKRTGEHKRGRRPYYENSPADGHGIAISAQGSNALLKYTPCHKRHWRGLGASALLTTGIPGALKWEHIRVIELRCTT